MGRTKKLLGELLVDEGLITEQQVLEALELQRKMDKKLGEILVESGYLSENDLYKTLSKRLGIEFISLENYDINLEAVMKINQALAYKYCMIPINFEGDKLVVAMEDPTNIVAIDDLSLYTKLKIVPVLASQREITKEINRFFGQEVVQDAVEEYKKENQLGEEEEAIAASTEEANIDAPIVKMVNSILEQAVRSRASDIHIEPYEKKARVRFRVDGSLREISQIDLRILPAMITRIKILGGMNIAERRRPQDGRANFKLENAEYDLRISSVPTMYGEKVVLRVNDKSGLTKDKNSIGLLPEDMRVYDEILKSPNGIILVTGPTGSGKTTTLYATLRELNKEDVNILTVEDPIESLIQGVNQVQVNVKAGVDFPSVLRTFLRQDPDIIMVGEIRDSETANIAVRAAITGHLVLSTLHTNDAPSTIARLIDMGIEPFLLATALNGVVAQRLVKRLCDKCKQEYEPTEKEYGCLDLFDKSDVHFYKPVGCKACNNTGYSGRIGVFEVMPISSNIRQLITRGATTDEIKFVAMREGLSTIWRSCSKLVAQGKTTIDELIRIAYVEE
ncbi:MAG: Flp pilus assembly complex ATPase component TadA [Clostridia bacterium]|nr:Flp pilus assembly complex ATPase component TadA [Clostridia bacterium]